MILHTLTASPSSSTFTQCCAVARTGDAILLMSDGVYAAVTGSSARTALLATGAHIYALQGDVEALGVKADDTVTCIGMEEFVTLTEQYPRQQAWH